MVVDELDAVHLADLERARTIYRVFLLPDALQFDLSMTPAAQFHPAGPRFRLLFGETAPGEREVPAPPVARDLFGWGVIYALHARSCIERGRFWQAEHYVGAVRDHALSLACLREGCPRCRRAATTISQQETLARCEAAHLGRWNPSAPVSLAASVRALMREGEGAGLLTRKPSASASRELH